MCRLTGFINTGFSEEVLIRLVDRSLIYGSGVEDNKDGWGITDGRISIKSASPYFADTSTLFTNLPKIDWTRPILTHVRRASNLSTKSNVKDAHPYHLKVRDRYLFLMHQGLLTGLQPINDEEKALPGTDTYRGLVKLAQLLEDEGEVSAKLFNRFSEELYASSTFTFLLSYGDACYAVAGKGKYLHIMEAGNGWIIHTSSGILNELKSTLLHQYSISTSDITKIPDKTLITFKDGYINYTDLQFSMKEVVETHTLYTPYRQGWGGFNRKDDYWGDYDSSGGYTYTQRKTNDSPKHHTAAIPNSVLVGMKKATASLRTTSMLLWYLWKLRSESRRAFLDFDVLHESQSAKSDFDILMNLIQREEKTYHGSIDEWKKFMLCSDTCSSTPSTDIPLLTSEERKIINYWNKLVPKNNDLHIALSLASNYSICPFWKIDKQQINNLVFEIGVMDELEGEDV